MKIGYARVSTDDQSLDLQLAALSEAGCRRIFQEKVSGVHRDRPELARLLDHLREVGHKLAGSYGWTEEAAVYFVLTGETPEIKPLDVRARVSSNEYAPPQWRITLNVNALGSSRDGQERLPSHAEAGAQRQDPKEI